MPEPLAIAVKQAMFGGAALDRAASERDAWQWLDFVGLAGRARALPTEVRISAAAWSMNAFEFISLV